MAPSRGLLRLNYTFQSNTILIYGEASLDNTIIVKGIEPKRNIYPLDTITNSH